MSDRCRCCGKFVSPEKARSFFTPDTHFTAERTEYECEQCATPEATEKTGSLRRRKIKALRKEAGRTMNLVDSINRWNAIKRLEEENGQLLAEYHRLRAEIERAYAAAEKAGLEIDPGMCVGRYDLDTVFEQVKSIVEGSDERRDENEELRSLLHRARTELYETGSPELLADIDAFFYPTSCGG
jgi:hypothetical protein